MRAQFTLLAITLFIGCGRTVSTPRTEKCIFDSDCSQGLRCINRQCGLLELPDAGSLLGKKRFGERCDAGAECGSTLCIGAPAGSFCSSACDVADAGCPSSYTCKHISVEDAGSVDVCAVPQPLLCQACTDNSECGASGADTCLSLDGGRFCGRDCTFEGCPPLYACQEFLNGTKQCAPEGRTCDCLPQTLGLQKPCRGEPNAFGRCLGNQMCQVDGGFTGCEAPSAQEETCNGADDDCNGAIDDFTAPECTLTVGNVTCRGPQVCFASAGLVCTARSPAAEACNYEDDDCDGEIDEDFRPLGGVYSSSQHCGGCNNDCSKAIAHALTTQCSGTDEPKCTVSQCEAGYFPYADNSMCLQLPDTLCSPCQIDADCVGPASRCLMVDGARVCGRDCSPSSAYPAGCPGGYSCQLLMDGAAQCVPTTGTCSCTAETLGSTRSCQLSSAANVCTGFSTCAVGGAGPDWSGCDVNTFNPEICDARDNNCDLQVDEGFLNQATGRYEAAQHCGFCNNDCTKYFSPSIEHTTGVCDLNPVIPKCTMGPCLTEIEGPTTYEWVNVNGQADDGCECRRVQGNLTTDLPDRASGDGAALSWADENCDGIDGVLSDAIFVSASAAAGGNGTRTSPLQTIAEGISAQQAQSKRYVLVAQGLYRENVRLFEGAQIFGGYAQDFLKRDPRLYTTAWRGVAPSNTAIAAVHAEALGTGVTETVVAGFTITGWDASAGPNPGEPGAASIAVFLNDVGPGFVLQSNDVIGGRGGTGARGSTGTQGHGRQTSSSLNGQEGRNSNHFPNGLCTLANHQAGGEGGNNSVCGGTNGTQGGNAACPIYSFVGNQGAQQMYSLLLPGAREGLGGFDWSFDTLSSPSCGHVTESGFPNAIQQHDGEDGKPGDDGTGGLGGAGASTSARFGSFVGNRWVASPAVPSGGQPGLTALGGGGGGAGGGVARFILGGCTAWEIGASGGGAGAGGCGGTGGSAGGAGGASLTLMIVSSVPNAALPTLLNNRIARGPGGNGGDGGFAGAGGLGGSGAFGGTADRWSSSVGGKGGEGGNGGPGGGGGGGAGGPSFAVLGYNISLSAWSSSNTFLTPSVLNTAGPGGAGGSSPGPLASSGTAGTSGASDNSFELQSCAVPCVGGTCDANGVCVPN